MRQEIQDRCMLLGRYIARTGATVRQAAERFGMSKSSVHKDVHERLRTQFLFIFLLRFCVLNHV